LTRTPLTDAVRDEQWAEETMGKAILLMLAVASVGAAIPGVAAGGLPYCIKGCDFGGGAGDCSFTSYQQCLATASGRDATCAANPYYNAKAELQPDRGRVSRRRF
jgi:hypothetical protein